MTDNTDAASLRAPLWKFLASQLGGSIFALGLILALPSLWGMTLTLAGLQGVFAVGLAKLFRSPGWWLAINAIFVPLAVIANGASLPTWIWLCGFVLLLLVFWRTDRSRVPLYLTNSIASARIAALLPPNPCHVVDLGCGDGGLLLRLAATRPDCQFVGFEHAPLPWLWGWWRSRGKSNVAIRFGDFWRHSLKEYELAYAFLSPTPMPDLWSKVQREMQSNGLLISNSFEIPGVTPAQIIDIDDRRRTRLYCYHPNQAPTR